MLNYLLYKMPIKPNELVLVLSKIINFPLLTILHHIFLTHILPLSYDLNLLR